MIKGVKKMLEKDLAVASNIGKWLIIIALSGIGLYLLFWIVVMVLLAIYVAPKLKTLVKRLRDSPILKTGSTREKCVVLMKETALVLFPQELHQAQFVKSFLSSCEHSMPVGEQAGKLASSAYSADDHTAPAYDSHMQATHAAASAAKHNLTPHSGPIGHGSDLTADSGPADGLGVHRVQ